VSEARRIGLIVGLTILMFAFVTWYLQLRRGHSKDFPFRWGSLFLNGLLLLAVGMLLVFIVVLAVQGSRRTQFIAVIVLGLPSAFMALADYAFTELDLDFIPGRLIREPGHEIGMIGLGAAVGLLAFALMPQQAADDGEALHAADVDAD